MSHTTPVDIVLSGGGLVGATLAVVLGQSLPHLSIGIVEAVPLQSDVQPSFDSRCLAIAQGSKQLLAQYGLWSSLAANAQPIAHIQVSDRGHIGKTYLHSEQFNYAALGYVAEVQDIGRVLMAKLKQLSNVKWFCPNQIKAIDSQQDSLSLTLDDGQTLQTSLLLGADGGNSTTRQLLNIANQSDDYQQVAIIANVGLGEDHQDWAYERFTDTGPMALLPMKDKRYSLVWCQTPKQAEQLMQLDDNAFIAQLQQAFGYRAGVFTQISARASYPLALTLAEQITAHRAALVGNSSHTIHPIAGQGFNLGLRDIEALRHILTSASDKASLGSFAQLHQYQQWRKQDLQQVVSMTDALVRLFSNSSRLLALGRSLGLLSMQLIDDLKYPLARQAMGFNRHMALDAGRGSL